MPLFLKIKSKGTLTHYPIKRDNGVLCEAKYRGESLLIKSQAKHEKN